MSNAILQLAEKTNQRFKRARVLRQQANQVSTFKPADKINLANQALDELEMVVAELIVKMAQLN